MDDLHALQINSLPDSVAATDLRMPEAADAEI